MPKKENSVQKAAGIGLALATPPILLDHYNTASRGENSGFDGWWVPYHIRRTENVSLPHAFDSDVDDSNKDDNLASDSRSPKYYKPEATAWLSRMRYRGGGGHFTCKKLNNPLKRSKKMSTIRDDYKTVDIVPKTKTIG